jgi:hypothetical protein
MEDFTIGIRNGVEIGGYDIWISVEGGKLCMEVTDGDHDRSYKLDAENTKKLLDSVGGKVGLRAIFPKAQAEPRNTDKFINAFKNTCEKHKVTLDYTSWMGSGCWEWV